jgi:photosystem II stability/assembly factor-like uncharacterized protein
MTNSMVRTFALAAVAAAAGLAAFDAETAVAGKTVSPFAGLFTGPLPDAYSTAAWGSIAISSDGKIVISQPPAGYSDERINGAVKDDGAYETYASWNPNKMRNWVTDVLPAPVARSDADADANLRDAVIHYVSSSGVIARGADGNLYGTTDRGNSFVWTRK